MEELNVKLHPETRALLESHLRSSGQTADWVVEQALLHHLQAIAELPLDLVVHPRLVVAPRYGETLLRELEHALPSEALQDLLRDGD